MHSSSLAQQSPPPLPPPLPSCLPCCFLCLLSFMHVLLYGEGSGYNRLHESENASVNGHSQHVQSLFHLLHSDSCDWIKILRLIYYQGLSSPQKLVIFFSSKNKKNHSYRIKLHSVIIININTYLFYNFSFLFPEHLQTEPNGPA